MTVKELYWACNNATEYRDVFIHDGGTRTNLYEIYPRDKVLDRKVLYFSVRDEFIHMFLEKEGE